MEKDARPAFVGWASSRLGERGIGDSHKPPQDRNVGTLLEMTDSTPRRETPLSFQSLASNFTSNHNVQTQVTDALQSQTQPH